MLFCCVSRPELESPLTRLQELARTDYADRSTEIALQALSPRPRARRWCGNLTTLDELPAPLRDAILAKAQGNPFFVEEIVRSLDRPRRTREGRGDRQLPGHRAGRAASRSRTRSTG